MEKSLVQIKEQMARIERTMFLQDFEWKRPKIYVKWRKIADKIDNNLLNYFGVEHLWEDGAVLRRDEPIPYEMRITR